MVAIVGEDVVVVGRPLGRARAQVGVGSARVGARVVAEEEALTLEATLELEVALTREQVAVLVAEIAEIAEIADLAEIAEEEAGLTYLVR